MEIYCTTDRKSISSGGHGLNSLELTILEIIKEEEKIRILGKADGRDGLVEAVFNVDIGTSGVPQENTEFGSGKQSIRTIRNALRVPKKMKLIESVDVGVVQATEILMEADSALKAATQRAEEIRQEESKK